MVSFIISHIFSHKARTFAFALSVLLLFILSVSGVYIYTNIKQTLNYYGYNGIDSRRFVIQSSDNILNLFGSDKQGIPETILQQLKKDTTLERVQAYYLVEIPVVADIGIFAFSLETDIPVFAVSDGTLTGATVPIGISRSMIDFYNTQLAGSASFFPQMPESLLLGRTIKFTFGKSKLFPSLSTVSSEIQGNITKIDSNFPGFGIVLPESIVREKLQEIGYSEYLRNPYKIIAYMKDVNDIEKISEKLTGINVTFDQNRIRSFQKKLDTLKLGIGFVVVFLIAIVGVFFLFLLAAYFRERRDVFRMISIFGLQSFRSYIFSSGEPLFVTSATLLFGGAGCVLLFSFLHRFLVDWMYFRGIMVPFAPLPGYVFLLIGCCIFILTALVIIGLDYRNRKKYIFR